ncbi:unnamed protein product [Trifolium pratense]|uniref:Uncharacterized protein n=1 Tax=Trifolium pratense TaxID=57577 RepID=A0ACB0M5N9_TRIPR|nr:unnamed protein product [Trifolium pratense]
MISGNLKNLSSIWEEYKFFSTLEERLDEVCSDDPLDNQKNTNHELIVIRLKNPNEEVNVPNRIPYTIKDVEEFKTECKDLLEKGLIRPSSSPHSAPAFYVENHNEIKRGKRRMVINYKKLNLATIGDSYGLPRKDFIFEKIKGTKEQHIKDVEIVLLRIKEKGIVISKKKSQLCKTEIEYLGVIIKDNGELNLAPHTQEKISAFPDVLVDRKQIQRFLGCLNYIANEGFFKDLAKERKILQKKISEKIPWSWTDEDTKIVKTIKSKIQVLPKLYNPTNDDFLVVEIDASKDTWAGCMRAFPNGKATLKLNEFGENLSVTSDIQSDLSLQDKTDKSSGLKRQSDLISKERKTDKKQNLVDYSAKFNIKEKELLLCKYISGTFSDTETRYPIAELETLACVRVLEKWRVELLPSRYSYTGMEQAIKILQHNLKQKDEQIEATQQRLTKLSSERGEIITTLQNLQQYTANTNISEPTEEKSSNNTKENWDLLGQDSGKYNYYVKYSAQAIAPSKEQESSETTSDSKKSWADEVEEEDEARKNGLSTTIQTNDPVDNEMGKFEAYVIFDGPMKGIYRKWAIAKQHIIGKNVRHKGYKTIKEAEQALYGPYKEITAAKDIQRSSTMESKKKLSIDKIRQLEHQKTFHLADPTFTEFSLRWKWINNYIEEFSTDCFYPTNKYGCSKTVLLPGIDNQLCLSFFQNGLISTIYLEEKEQRSFGELKYFPEELQNLVQKFNNLFAKGKEIFLQIDSTYPWYDEITLDLTIKPQYLIKIGISNKTYPTMSKEKNEWHPASYIAQMKHFRQKVTRLTQQTNYRVVYDDPSTVVYSDSRKPAKEKDLQAIKNLEERVDQLKKDYTKLPMVIREELCRNFTQSYKGHVCEICPPKSSAQNDKEALSGKQHVTM